jgi:uncharacterized RDD family membrane protein YckC
MEPSRGHVAPAAEAREDGGGSGRGEPRMPPSRGGSEAGRREPGPRSDRAPTFYVAGFWRRLGAGLLDAAVLIPLSLLLCWIAGAMTGLELPPANHRGLDFWLDMFLANEPALLGAIGLTLAIGLLYLFLFQATTGRTLGMRALGLRVIDVYGDPPTMLRAGGRAAAYLASVATLGLGFLWIGFDSEKRALHDWLAGTYVVKARA